MKEIRLRKTIDRVATFYEIYKVGYEGGQGYRKSSDLIKLSRCIYKMLATSIVNPEKTIFMDLGCGDGRVNVLFSYFVKKSIGIEIDADILFEHKRHEKKLEKVLVEEGLILPPSNIYLQHGDSLEDSTLRKVYENTDIIFSDIDIFYTYITLHDLFAEKISNEAKRGAYFVLYGFHKILPNYPGLKLLSEGNTLEEIVAIYRKE